MATTDDDAIGECPNCDAPAERDGFCLACWLDPDDNDFEQCGERLSWTDYPYVCGDCVSLGSDADIGECHRCGGIAPIGGDCPSPRCVAFREWAMANQDDEVTP